MEATGNITRAFRDRSLAITFTEADRQTPQPRNHPLYVPITLNGMEFQRGFVDGGASISIISYETFKKANIPHHHLIRQSVDITGFENMTHHTIGHVRADLAVGDIRSITKLHVIESSTTYHVLIGRSWLHWYAAVPSTYHQCVKAILNNKVITINASQKPFAAAEAFMADAIFYEEVECSTEVEPSPIKGITSPKWSQIEEGETSHSKKSKLRPSLERAKNTSYPHTKPDGRVLYRL